jgi:hypothetical protein
MTRAEKRQAAILYVALWDASIGSVDADVKARFTRMLNPQSGDTVVEVTTIRELLVNDPKLRSHRWVGQFVRLVEKRPDGTAVCRLSNGREFVWRNAQVAAVPTE